MEESIKLLDFETVDQMVQIHGASLSWMLAEFSSLIRSWRFRLRGREHDPTRRESEGSR